MGKRKFLRRMRRLLNDHADGIALLLEAQRGDPGKPLEEVERGFDPLAGVIWTTPGTGQYTVRCTCGTCPIHGNATYTTHVPS